MRRGTYYYSEKVRKQRRSSSVLPTMLLVIATASFTYFAYNVIIPTQRASESATVDGGPVLERLNTNLQPSVNGVQWPKEMQSAIGAVGYGVLAQNKDDAQAVPMASLAKVMAALLIIENGPVAVGNPGDVITFTTADEALYNKYLLEGGVVTKVKTDQAISQREALEAMLITSSNNIADTAVIAAFGSIEAYLEQANQRAQELGLQNTVFADVTGFSPQSKSTAAELVKLADYAMREPLFAEIVSIWQTTILSDTVELTNTNTFLDYEGNGVIGIKSGLTDEAGGTFMTAAERVTPDGDTIIVLAVTLGATSHFSAQEASMPLLDAAELSFIN